MAVLRVRLPIFKFIQRLAKSLRWTNYLSHKLQEVDEDLSRKERKVPPCCAPRASQFPLEVINLTKRIPASNNHLRFQTKGLRNNHRNFRPWDPRSSFPVPMLSCRSENTNKIDPPRNLGEPGSLKLRLSRKSKSLAKQWERCSAAPHSGGNTDEIAQLTTLGPNLKII